MSFVCTFWRCPDEIHNQPLNAEHKEGPQPGDSRLVGGRRNKQGNLPTRHISAPPTKILKGFIESLMQFSHIQSPGDLNKMLFSQDLLFFFFFAMAVSMRTVGGTYTFKDRGRMRSLCLCWSTGTHTLSLTSSNCI